MNKLFPSINPSRTAKLGGLVLLAAALLGCSSMQGKPQGVAAGSSCGALDPGATAKLYEAGRITRAEPIQQLEIRARADQRTTTRGATLYVKAEEGMNAPYLHRVLSCHAASEKAAHPNDPLHPASGEVKTLAVRDAGGSFAVDVRADSARVGQEIWQRAQALTQKGGSVEVEQVAVRPRASEL